VLYFDSFTCWLRPLEVKLEESVLASLYRLKNSAKGDRVGGGGGSSSNSSGGGGGSSEGSAGAVVVDVDGSEREENFAGYVG